MKTDTFTQMLSVLHRLDEAKAHYTIACHRDDALMVKVDVPGERWEVEFMADGTMEIERFRSSGDIFGEESLDVLFSQFLS